MRLVGYNALMTNFVGNTKPVPGDGLLLTIGAHVVNLLAITLGILGSIYDPGYRIYIIVTLVILGGLVSLPLAISGLVASSKKSRELRLTTGDSSSPRLSWSMYLGWGYIIIFVLALLYLALLAALGGS